MHEIIHKELKRAIVYWLLDNENRWQRVNACKEEFRPYIYDTEGNYLIDGKEILGFIIKTDEVLYG